MSGHNVCFWEVTGISSHESIPESHKNNQDNPNGQAEDKHYHEMKDNQLLMGLADVFPGGIERNCRISKFYAWLPYSLVLGLARSWVNKAAGITPCASSWTHYTKSVLCKASGQKTALDKSSVILYLTGKWDQVETYRVCLWPGLIFSLVFVDWI